MSSMDSFFKKVEENNKAQEDSKKKYLADVEEFRTKTDSLFNEVMSWFSGSPIQASKSQTRLVEDGDAFSISTLALKNGEKTLKITPISLYGWGAMGMIEVSIYNPSRAPNTTKFEIRLHDSASQRKDWTIIYGGMPERNVRPQRGEFNQEHFFTLIESFA